MRKALRLSSLAIVLMALLTLTACAPKDAAAAKSKMEKKEYTVVEDTVVVPAALKLAKVEGVESVLVATNKDGETVTAILFEKASQAKDAFKAVKEYAEKHDSKTEAKRSGKWIYYGTEKGMKDFA